MIALQKLPQRPGVALHTVCAGDHQNSAVQYLKRPFHLSGKVYMARRVQQRHADGAKLQHRLLGKYGDAPLTLHGVRI